MIIIRVTFVDEEQESITKELVVPIRDDSPWALRTKLEKLSEDIKRIKYPNYYDD